jgi:hypothetical protein
MSEYNDDIINGDVLPTEVTPHGEAMTVYEVNAEVHNKKREAWNTDLTIEGSKTHTN